MKTCKGCGVSKDANQFTLNNSTKDTLSYNCKECDKLKRIIRKRTNKAIKRLKFAYRSNKDFIKQIDRCLVLRNRIFKRR